MKFYQLISVLLLFIINSTDKTLSVNKLCKKNWKIRPTFAEIFGQKWQIDQNSNWQNDQNELNLEDSIGNDQNNDQFNDQQKLEIVHKFDAIKEGIKKRGTYLGKTKNKIEQKICIKMGINRKKIYKWKKEFNLKKKKIFEKIYYEKKKQEFVERIDEFKRMYKNRKQKQFVKELGIGKMTLRKWKKEFGIEMSKRIRYLKEEKESKMNDYYQMKNENPSQTDKEIAGLLKVSIYNLQKWKKEKINRLL